MLIVVCRPGTTFTRADMADVYAGRVAPWWVPDELRIVDALPHTATGKTLKTRLREMFAA
jgi:fatty-acyl-CoA synthase